MSASILTRLRSRSLRQTKSDILISNYIERNLAELPFETAKSIAEGIGVSQMTVGRYLRRLGYDGLDELKREMRQSANRTAWQVKGKFDRLQRDIREGKLLAELIQQQIDDLGRMYELTASRQWQEAIRLLVDSEEVYRRRLPERPGHRAIFRQPAFLRPPEGHVRRRTERHLQRTARRQL